MPHTRKTFVGNDFVRGVSGGERKRVSLSEMLTTNAALICWDNCQYTLSSLFPLLPPPSSLIPLLVLTLAFSPHQRSEASTPPSPCTTSKPCTSSPARRACRTSSPSTRPRRRCTTSASIGLSLSLRGRWCSRSVPSASFLRRRGGGADAWGDRVAHPMPRSSSLSKDGRRSRGRREFSTFWLRGTWGLTPRSLRSTPDFLTACTSLTERKIRDVRFTFPLPSSLFYGN